MLLEDVQDAICQRHHRRLPKTRLLIQPVEACEPSEAQQRWGHRGVTWLQPGWSSVSALQPFTNPNGGVPPFHQMLTCLTHLTLGPHVAHIGSHDLANWRQPNSQTPPCGEPRGRLTEYSIPLMGTGSIRPCVVTSDPRIPAYESMRGTERVLLRQKGSS